MTRRLQAQSSRKKAFSSNEEVEKDQGKENVSPKLLRKNKFTANNKCFSSTKENVSPKNGIASGKICKSPPSPIRKSVRKISVKDSNKHTQISKSVKNVLSDKTNFSTSPVNLHGPFDQSFGMPVIKTVTNNNTKIVSVNSCKSTPSPIRRSVRNPSVKDLNKHVYITNDKNVLRDKKNNHTLPDNLQSPLDKSYGIPLINTVDNNNKTMVSVNICKSTPSPIRRSFRKPSVKDLNKDVKITNNRNVLSDNKNSHALPDNLQSPLDNSSGIPVIKTVDNKNTIIQKLVCLPKPSVDIKNKIHVPVYKTDKKFKEEKENKLAIDEKNKAVYDFEVDENEEPAHKKKRKKRVYTKKSKMGPRALTINNIKYSSSESLVSLPEKPFARKKKIAKTTKANLKTINSITNLASVEDSSCSVNSFMSHPPSMGLFVTGSTNTKRELSVLQESQSELNTSQAVSGNQEHLLPQSMNGSVVSRASRAPVTSSKEGISSSPWCPNSSLKTYQANSPCIQNISNASHDFLSSTPCKRTSAVICNNSAFDDTYDLPNSVRQSSGCMKDDLTANNSLNNCFGFDEPEELEEPLFSPIKSNINIDLESKNAVNKRPLKPLVLDEPDNLKPSPEEVIELLKASIPKDIQKQRVTDMFSEESEKVDIILPLNVDEEIIGSSFTKPPRRSYERQRRVRHKSETEEESEKEDCIEEKNEVVKEIVPKKGNKCYKRINTTRTVKHPKVTKAKQRLAKEEEELERLAAKMNAQFQEIEKVNLVVE